MTEAMNYFLNEWDGIEAIASGGDYAWDNNSIERCNRYVSLSRKNSLFFGSHAGAERGCIFYSLTCSCRFPASTSSNTSPTCSTEWPRYPTAHPRKPSAISSRTAGQRKNRPWEGGGWKGFAMRPT